MGQLYYEAFPIFSMRKSVHGFSLNMPIVTNLPKYKSKSLLAASARYRVFLLPVKIVKIEKE
jgi:hypothetical protein